MNYIHVHEKCLKCGECRLECEHRTKWTSASTSTSPNTESDKSIDDLKLTIKGIYNPNDKLLDRYVLLSDEAKSQLLAEILKGKDIYFDEGNTKVIYAVPITYLKELFNEKEK